MSENSSNKPESRSNVVTAVALEMKRSIWLLGGGSAVHGNRDRLFEKAARKAGITFRQARSLFYGETVDPKHSVVERVRNAVAALDRKNQEAARDEYRTLLARIERLEQALLVSDADFHGHQIDALRDVARGSDRPMD